MLWTTFNSQSNRTFSLINRNTAIALSRAKAIASWVFFNYFTHQKRKDDKILEQRLRLSAYLNFYLGRILFEIMRSLFRLIGQIFKGDHVMPS